MANLITCAISAESAGGGGVVSQSVHRWVNGGMQVAQVERRGAAAVRRRVFRGERRFAGDEHEVRQVAGSRFSDPQRPVAGRGAAYGVLGPSGFPLRWTFYIGKDGRIAAIEKKVNAGSHGAQVVGMLESLKSSLKSEV
jgi:hypothetical protein